MKLIKLYDQADNEIILNIANATSISFMRDENGAPIMATALMNDGTRHIFRGGEAGKLQVKLEELGVQ